MTTQARDWAPPHADPDHLDFPPAYCRSYAGTMLTRPVIVDAARARSVGRDLRDLTELLRSLPDRLCNGSLTDYAALLGVPGPLRALVTGMPLTRVPTYVRADLIDDGDRFRLLELNVGSELGGLDAAQMNRAWLGDPEFAGYAADLGLAYVDTAADTAHLLQSAGARIGTRTPRCVLVEGRHGIAEHEPVFLAIAEAVADYGIDLELAELHHLETSSSGRIQLAGRPVDVVLRYASAPQLVGDEESIESYRRLEQADRDGVVSLVTPLSAALMASKATLAVLHDPATRAVLDPVEDALVDRLVPWTALLARLEGRSLEEVLAHPADYVVKPGIGYSGVGTVMGAVATPAQWRQAVLHPSAEDYVVQRRVRPAPEAVRDLTSGALEEWHANWGIFATGAGYAGGFVRALKPSDGTVIGYANGGTRGAPIFTVEEGRLR